jgi:opacity protein-like surface antigen
MSWLLTLLLAHGPAGDEGLPLTLKGDVVVEDGAAPEAPEALGADDDDDKKGQKDRASFSIGPVAGYLKTRDADDGTWFGGLAMRLRFARIFAIEGSITFHNEEFSDGDIEVTQYPVQVSALILPLPDSPVEPYGIVGAGWYYTRVDFEGPLDNLDSDTDRSFGWHVGAGLQVEIGKHFALFGDFRWVFLDEPGIDNGDLDDEDWDQSWVTLGGMFTF